MRATGIPTCCKFKDWHHPQLLTCKKTLGKRHFFSEKGLSSLWKSKQLNKPLIIRIMTMTFNLLQGNFNLVFDFALLATLKLHQTVKRGGNRERTKDKIRSYTNFTFKLGWKKNKVFLTLWLMFHPLLLKKNVFFCCFIINLKHYHFLHETWSNCFAKNSHPVLQPSKFVLIILRYQLPLCQPSQSNTTIICCLK